MALPGYWSDHVDLPAINYLKDSIDAKILALFNDRRDVLFDVKRGFTRRIYYTQNGERLDDNYRHEVPSYPELPADYDIDPINQLIARYGEANWEDEAWTATRPDIPVPETIRELCPHPMEVYTVYRNGVPYLVSIALIIIYKYHPCTYNFLSTQIRSCDPASILCDIDNDGRHNIYPKVLCTSHKNIMPEVHPL